MKKLRIQNKNQNVLVRLFNIPLKLIKYKYISIMILDYNLKF